MKQASRVPLPFDDFSQRKAFIADAKLDAKPDARPLAEPTKSAPCTCESSSTFNSHN